MAFDHDAAAAELCESGFIGLSFDQDEVAATVVVAGIKETIFQGFLIGEEEEAFGVHVEASEGEALWREVELLERALAFVTRICVELAEDAVGFVESDQHLGWRSSRA